MSKISNEWHGIPRKDIPWYPTVDKEKCIGCGLCFVTCGRNVYEIKNKKAEVVNAYNCLVGCTTCATICPVSAISFPEKELVHKIEKEHAILQYVQKESKKKGAKIELEKARIEAEKIVLHATHRVEFVITGHILEKNIPKKLIQLVSKCSCDIISFKIETPSLRVCFDEQAPSSASFTLVSQKYDDVSDCMEKIDKLLEQNNIVVVEHKKIS